MKSATVTEFKKHPDMILKAAKSEPMTITDHGKPILVIHKASSMDALARAKAAVKSTDDDLNDFGVFDW